MFPWTRVCLFFVTAQRFMTSMDKMFADGAMLLQRGTPPAYDPGHMCSGPLPGPDGAPGEVVLPIVTSVWSCFTLPW